MNQERQILILFLSFLIQYLIMRKRQKKKNFKKKFPELKSKLAREIAQGLILAIEHAKGKPVKGIKEYTLTL